MQKAKIKQFSSILGGSRTYSTKENTKSQNRLHK